MASPAPRISRASVGLRSDRGPILLSLMLSTALVALDSTVIATAIPTITADLGGFTQFPWLLSIYLLAQAASTPIYGKLADIVGRKPLMLAGVAVFLAGSILAGFAWSMPALIVFRAVQGLGAGAIMPMSITIAGDIYTVEERATAQGYLASVWGVSAVAGPLIGGIFSEWVSWRWIFWVNIPLCLVAGWILARSFHEKVERRPHRVDYLGAILLTASSILVLLGLLEGGQAWAWGSVTGVAVLGGGVLLGVLFMLRQRVAPEPVLPLWVFRRRILVTTTIASLAIGAVVLGLTSYVPTFVQISLGTGALVAGFSVATMTLGWPFAASLAGRVYLRWGFRTTSLLGAVIVAVGAGLLLLLDDASTPWEVGAFCLVVGVGMGFSAVPTMVAAQSSVGWSERGVVTSANMFARSIGSAVGVAVYGAVVNATLGTHAGHPSGPELATAVHRVFVGVVAGAALLLVAVLLMPRRVPADAVPVPADGDTATADGDTAGADGDGPTARQTVGGAA